MRQDEHETLLRIVKRLPLDYSDFGKTVRWEDPKKPYPDCSCGCAFAKYLEGSTDWLVCTNPKSHRAGLLTFEHQGCLEFKPR